MKVAVAVGFFCLVLTLVEGALFQVPPEISIVDGEIVVQCTLQWDGQTYTLAEGESTNLPPDGDEICYECGSCGAGGMSCAGKYVMVEDGKGGYHSQSGCVPKGDLQ